MEKFMQGVNRFIRDEEGVTAIEYGLLAALIAVAIIVGATLVGTNLNALFNAIGAKLGVVVP
jgi:pilus assembly protein Flp/PilA